MTNGPCCIGPNPCSTCGGEYGEHAATCPNRPAADWLVSDQCFALWQLGNAMWTLLVGSVVSVGEKVLFVWFADHGGTGRWIKRADAFVDYTAAEAERVYRNREGRL
jgi:hypothetical protein